MAIININAPPIGVTVNANPTVNELAMRSTNTFSHTPRRSLDGRRLVGRVNQTLTLTMQAARTAISDEYPAGVDPTIDNTKSGGGGGGGGGGTGIEPKSNL